LSTGERSIALHLPMLASITAHYDGSGVAGMVGCPRLILLDELFAGVDQSNRGQLFRLFVDWDLDAIFPSDHLWAAFGVQKDSLSPSVLVLGLRPSGDDPLICGLRAMAEASEPARITLSQVRRWPFGSGAGSDVFVFENPSILAEAAARGWAEPPLVCTSGCRTSPG
jgi:hypothetical protein